MTAYTKTLCKSYPGTAQGEKWKGVEDVIFETTLQLGLIRPTEDQRRVVKLEESDASGHLILLIDVIKSVNVD